MNIEQESRKYYDLVLFKVKYSSSKLSSGEEILSNFCLSVITLLQLQYGVNFKYLFEKYIAHLTIL